MNNFFKYVMTGEGFEEAVTEMIEGTANTSEVVNVMTKPSTIHLGSVSRAYAEWLMRHCRAAVLGLPHNEPRPRRWANRE